MNHFSILFRYFTKRHGITLILLSLWIFLLTLLVSWVTSLTPIREGIVNFLKLLSPYLQNKIGRDITMLGSVTGTLSLTFLDPFMSMPFILWSMMLPLKHLASDQERGLLDLLFAKPLSRLHWTFSILFVQISGKLFLFCFLIGGFSLGIWLFLDFSNVEFRVFLQIAFIQLLWYWLVGSIAAFFSSFTGKFRLSLVLTFIFLFIMYTWELTCRHIVSLKSFSRLSYWHWVDPRNLFSQIVPFQMSIFVFMISILLLWSYTIYHFYHRDLIIK